MAFLFIIRKKLKDEDEEVLKNLKEQFLDDGELNTEGSGRTKKFAWSNKGKYFTLMLMFYLIYNLII